MVGVLSVEVVVGLVCASTSFVIRGDVFAAIMVVAGCFLWLLMVQLLVVLL